MEETTPVDSFPAGGSGQVLKRKCRGCKSVQNVLDNRSKKNPKLRQALKRKSKEQQAQYFRDKKKQRVGIPNGVGHNFDDLEYEEKEVSYVGEEFRRRVLWKPYAVWRDERKQKAIDTAEIDETDEGSMELWEEDASTKWIALLQNANTKKQKVDGVWHVLTLGKGTGTSHQSMRLHARVVSAVATLSIAIVG